MSLFRLRKGDLGKFLRKAAESSELIAPLACADGLVRFQQVRRGDGAVTADLARLDLKRQAFFPAKEFFFPQEEEVLAFEGGGVRPVLPPRVKRVFFGLRLCDLNAIARQDLALLSPPVDAYYARRREGALLLGWHCRKPPHEYCFCGSLGLRQDCCDALFFDRGGELLVEVNSRQGEEFIKSFKGLFKPRSGELTPRDRAIPGASRLEKKDLSAFYDSAAWEEGVAKCLSCAACTALCPTCYCFELKEEAPSCGSCPTRSRCWSSCQLESFTRVAGGFVFRKSRADRFKHRIYHQLQYFREKHGVDLCVGCGRCIAGCPTRIDFVKIINGLK
ncbi:MAG: 4Fe-4S dicluster domain-containing protein [Candidatus Micrarchaeota archaeon]